jgi:glycosyltransferase involved in cell wall biosynthesis
MPVSVLQVMPSISPVHGGPSAAIAIIERALIAEGLSVETVTTDDDGPGRRLDKPQEKFENSVLRRYFRKDTDFYCYSSGLSKWLRSNAKRYDIIHTHGMFVHGAIAGAAAARGSGVPYVVRPLGTLTKYGLAQKPALKKLSMRFFERPMLLAASAVHLTSEKERAELALLGLPVRPVVIPLAVEKKELGKADRFFAKYPTLRDSRRILFLSRIDPKKNLQTLLEAIAIVQRTEPHVALIVCGTGPPGYVAALKGLAETLGINDRVVWAGFVMGQDMADVLAASEVFTLPSFSENFGIAAIEALFAGLPCVLGEGVAVSQEIAGAGCGFAVRPEPGPVADALLAVLAKDASSLSRDRVRSFAEARFSPLAMGKALAALYRDVLGGRCPPIANGRKLDS